MKDIRVQTMAVLDYILINTGSIPRTAIVYATGITDREVKSALIALKTAKYIDCDADYGLCRNSGHIEQMLVDRAIRLRSEADKTDAFLTYENLADLRTRLGWTQQQTAEFLGIPRSTYSLYELGSRQPDRDILSRLTKALKYGVTLDRNVASEKHFTKNDKDLI